MRYKRYYDEFTNVIGIALREFIRRGYNIKFV